VTTVSILPVAAAEGGTIYRALAGEHRGTGMTPGEALDAILDQDESTTLCFRNTRLICRQRSPAGS
jgi:hypothetical protein